jgi:hypothetical protein
MATLTRSKVAGSSLSAHVGDSINEFGVLPGWHTKAASLATIQSLSLVLRIGAAINACLTDCITKSGAGHGCGHSGGPAALASLIESLS